MSTRFFVPCITSYHCRRTSALSFARRRQTINAWTSFFSVPASVSRFVPLARIKAGPDSDEKRCTEGTRRPPCISFQYCIFQKERIDDELALSPLSSSISSAFPERVQIRSLSGILVRGACEMSHSNYSIPSAFEAQARSIRNSLRLRRSGSLSRTPSAISSYMPFGIGTVPGTPLEFTTTNRDSPSSSK